VEGFESLPRVTSDCRSFKSGGTLSICEVCGAIQKPNIPNWELEINEIYSSYQPYHQSNGIEQSVFDNKSGEPRLRSEVLVDFIEDKIDLDEKGDVLDVGCGNGALLKALSRKKSKWNLFGHEINSLHLKSLSELSNFKKLYTGATKEIGEKFDLVTMIHSLEHFINPFEELNIVKEKLKLKASLFVQVPNAEVTPFDLLVTDHASHFTSHDLYYLLTRVGFKMTNISDLVVTKELTLTANIDKKFSSQRPRQDVNLCRARLKHDLNWLNTLIRDADEMFATQERCGIFGSSIVAVWLNGIFDDKIKFFVDEDLNRIGRNLCDKPIFSPDQVPNGSAVYLALIPEVAKRVSAKLQRPGIKYCTLEKSV
jgi:2-polyprenyl-3-methyl-5-hydroxy-6-metoxy-1,4-benzoquinol methylase